MSQWLWIMVCIAEPAVVNHGVLCWARGVNHSEIWWANGCESWCAMVSPVVVNRDVLWWAKWLWILVCYDVPVAGNHGLSCCGKGCESWWVMLSKWLWIMVGMLWQWMWIMVCSAEAVVTNHVVFCCASFCESLCFAEQSCCETWCVILS